MEEAEKDKAWAMLVHYLDHTPIPKEERPDAVEVVVERDLMAAGLPLPKRLLVHGWWLAGKAKMSKSLGNVVDPLDLREEFGTDAVRWYLMREMPTGADASYTPERFLARYGELANVLGNLASRAT